MGSDHGISTDRHTDQVPAVVKPLTNKELRVAVLAYWKGAKRMFANFSDDTIMRGFLQDFGARCLNCTVTNLTHRLKRMKVHELNQEKTHA